MPSWNWEYKNIEGKNLETHRIKYCTCLSRTLLKAELPLNLGYNLTYSFNR